MRLNLPLILLLTLIISSCKTTRYGLEDYPDRQIIFGAGGGVTGQYETYTLFENGQFFYTNSISKETKALSDLPKSRFKALVKEMKAMDFKENTFQKPGNYNHFISLKEGEESYEYKWAEGSAEVDPEVKRLFKSLMGLTKAES